MKATKIGTRSPIPQPSDTEILDYIQKEHCHIEYDREDRTWSCCNRASNPGEGRSLRAAVIDSMRTRNDRRLKMGEWDKRYLAPVRPQWGDGLAGVSKPRKSK
jgi:hypothetical protein